MGILLATAPQLHQVRVKLRVDPDENDNGGDERQKGDLLFETLWSAWMQCTVSSICLALISRRYELAYETLKFVSHQNLSEDDLSEFDRLVQLIESPGFTLLRFELLQRPPVLIGNFLFQRFHFVILSHFIRYLDASTTIKIIRRAAQTPFCDSGDPCTTSSTQQ